MAVNEKDVELIVKQILSQMGGGSGTPASYSQGGTSYSGSIPKTAKVAMLVEKERFVMMIFLSG